MQHYNNTPYGEMQLGGMKRLEEKIYTRIRPIIYTYRSLNISKEKSGRLLLYWSFFAYGELRASTPTGMVIKHTSILIYGRDISLQETTQNEFKFNVLVFTEKNFDVYLIYEGKKYLMELDFYPLYSYKMPKSTFSGYDEIKYHFGVYEKESSTIVIDEEEFERIHYFNTSDFSTYNHIFKRKHDFYELKYIPRVYKKFNYTEPSELFDDRFVSTIVLQLDQTNSDLLDKYHSKPSKGLDDLKARMIYISPYAVKVFPEVSLNLSGDRSITNRKLSYKITDIEDHNGEGLYKRKALKLRANQADSSYIREKLVYSLADAMGIPSQGCTFTRLIINEKSIGFFTLVDHISNYNFMKEVLNNGNGYNKKDDALLFKVDNIMTSVGNMVYYGEDVDADSLEYKAYELKKSSYCKKNNIPIEEYNEKAKRSQLIPLFKKINDLTKLNLDTFENEVFHVESLLRSLVLDYLCQGVDNYLYWGNNYYLYKAANKEKNDYRWYFVSTDFHFTFGSDGFSSQIKDNFYNQSTYNSEIDPVRQPLTKLLEVDYNKYSKRIETIICDTVKSAFNVPTLYAYIDSLIQMIYSDIEWDLLLSRVNFNGKIGKIYNIEFFVFSVTDEKNLLVVPMPLKTFVRYRVRYTSEDYSIDAPKQNETVPVGPLGYTKPKYASIYDYDEINTSIANCASSFKKISIKSVLAHFSSIFLTLISIICMNTII
ncbi:coth protein-domain-containing protein [Neocallimastix lanati (nom. inval.)]|nr:coth protein-domain-containing protein [Neocallimastix sp. JGI-2020a]